MKNNLIYLLLITILIKIEKYQAIQDLKDSFKKISEHVRDMKNNFEEKFKRQPVSYLPDLDENLLEYPGKDPVKLQIIRKKWDKYYQCLDEQILLYEPHKMIPVVATMAFVGTTKKLQCGLCLSPDEANMSPDWYYSDIYNRSAAECITEEKLFISISSQDSTLNIFNIQGYDAGLYYCKFKKLTGPEYYVHIADDLEPTTTVWPYTAQQANHPLKETVNTKLGVTIRSEWSDWTNCNRCGFTGKRMRYGPCMVYTNINEKELKNSGILIFQHFTSGIPCRSKLLPLKVRNEPDVKNRPSEIMTGYCKIPCKGAELFIEYDEKKDRNIFNNTNGTYSYMQKSPPTTKSPIRLPVFAEYNKKVILICPGNLKEDTPVLWTIGRQLMYGPTLKNKTKGRITLNNLNHIVFKNVAFSDTKIYSCWQNKELAGQIHLIIMQKSNKGKYDTIISITAISMVFGIFIFMFHEVYTRSSMKKQSIK